MNSEFSADEIEEKGVDVVATSKLATSLQSLVLLGDDPYLGMQAFNLGVVSQILDDMEHQLLRDYISEERTPSTAIVVSAISQLWVFGLYELLRTWRQRATQVLAFGKAVAELSTDAREARIAEQVEKARRDSADPAFANPTIAHAFEVGGRDEEFRRTLRTAFDRSELPFRRLEALRVHLAKHEVPKSRGLYGMAPGYGRIDESSGSLFWEVPLGKMEVDHISRQSLAEACERFPSNESISILPEIIQQKLTNLPKHSYGVKHVTLILDDGTECDAFVAWDRQILKVMGDPPMFVDPNQVIDVRGTQDQAEDT